jgi:hypothetical protein
MGWQYLLTDGEFRPLASRKRLQIEFYGDSITAETVLKDFWAMITLKHELKTL